MKARLRDPWGEDARMRRGSRRLWLAASAAALVTAGRRAGAQPQPGAKRVGFLAGGNAGLFAPYRAALMAGLRQRGWIEGSNLVVDMRHADGNQGRAAALAQELLGAQPDVMVTGSDVYAQIIARATKTVPIVFVIGLDPVGLGLVKSLAHPGGNVTGLSVLNDELTGKRLELLKQTLPDVRRVGMLLREGDARAQTQFDAAQRIAAARAITLLRVPARDRDDIAPAIARAVASGVTALVSVADSLLLTERKQVIEACLRHRLAAIFAAVEYADDGALMAYSPAYVTMFALAAEPIDRILRGASPAGIPVQQATSFEFVINLKTARALGIQLPNTVLLQATRLIE